MQVATEEYLVSGIVPEAWIEQSVDSEVRKVYSEDWDYITVYHNPGITKKKFDDLCMWEYMATTEHLSFMGRPESEQLFLLMNHNRNAILTPWLGYPMEGVISDWYSSGNLLNRRPIKLDEFYQLVDALIKADHVHEESGIWNLVKHPSRGPCFVDITMQFGRKHERMYRNLLDVARALLMDYYDLPDVLQQQIRESDYHPDLISRHSKSP